MLKFAVLAGAIACISGKSLEAVKSAALETSVTSFADIEGTTFKQWATAFEKTYSVDEAAQYEATFEANKAVMIAHNAREKQGLETYRMGLNQFSDLTQAQFKQRHLSTYNRTTPLNPVVLPTVQEPLDGVDWRTKGAVTAVKNQGSCGSCWAFSTTGSTEGAVQIATGRLISLSEQQLMDCSTAEGDHSCQGGLMDYAFKYIIENKGLDTESDYPYKMANEACDTAKEKNAAITISGFQDVTKNSDAQLIAAITKGPVSVAIEADQAGFQHYASGVFSGPCGQQLDHGVLAVGYTDQYYIVKNSWGATWGNAGYIFMARNVQAPVGICGILQSASYPTGGAIGPNPGPPGPPSPPGPPPPGPPSPPGPAECTAVNPGNRTDCGFTLDKAECNAKGCCYDDTTPGTFRCFFPDVCSAVSPGERKDCGYNLTQNVCTARGCCWDTSVPFTYDCFFKAKPGPTPGPPPPGPPSPPPPPPPGPSGGHYEDPSAGPCQAGEEKVTITGLAGDFCSPSCSTTQPCPTDMPAGCDAKPSCVLSTSSGAPPSQCALECTPGTTKCPEKATCKPIQGIGICTYDS